MRIWGRALTPDEIKRCTKRIPPRVTGSWQSFCSIRIRRCKPWIRRMRTMESFTVERRGRCNDR